MQLSGRSVFVSAVALVALGAVATIVLLRGPGGGTVDPGERLAPDTGVNAAGMFAGDPDQVLQTSGTLLQLRSVDGKTEKDVAEVPSGVIAAAPGSKWLAYADVSGGRAEPPTIHLLDPGSSDDVEIGPGTDPLWDATGSRLAFQEPSEGCDSEVCDVGVWVVSPDSPAEPVKVVDEGPWRIEAWAGDYLLVGDREHPAETLVVGSTGDQGRIDIPSDGILAGSPDGKWIAVAASNRARLVGFEGGAVTGGSSPLDVNDESVLSATWAPDSSEVALVLRPAPIGDGATDLRALRKQLKNAVKRGELTREQAKRRLRKAIEGTLDDSLTHVVRFAAADPSPRPVDLSFGTRDLFWSPNLDALLLIRSVGGRLELLQSYYCSLEQAGNCRLLGSWSQGVQILRLQ